MPIVNNKHKDWGLKRCIDSKVFIENRNMDDIYENKKYNPNRECKI